MACDLSILLLFSTFLLFLLLLHLDSALSYTCSTMVCKPGEPKIRYPFRLKQLQPEERCGLPGFDLSCNDQNRTILSLPLSGEFIVASIGYMGGVISIEDPDGCLPKRLQSFTTLGSSWTVRHYTNFTLFRCPLESRASHVFPRLPCLDGHDHSVVAVAMDDPATRMNKLWEWLRCNFSQTISVPTTYNSLIEDGRGFPSSVVLSWDMISPCFDCVLFGGTVTHSPPPPPPPGTPNRHRMFYKMFCNNFVSCSNIMSLQEIIMSTSSPRDEMIDEVLHLAFSI